MNLDKAGRLQEVWKAKHGDQPCKHTRVVAYLNTPNGQKTGELVCRECGAIHPNKDNPSTDSSSL